MAKRVVHRVTTQKANGSASMEVAPVEVSIGEGIRQAVEAVGAVVIDPGTAPEALRQLATCYEAVVRAKTAYEAKREAAKTAKASLDLATEALLERVRAVTHPAALPLFDAGQAEQDLTAMVNSAEII